MDDYWLMPGDCVAIMIMVSLVATSFAAIYAGIRVSISIIAIDADGFPLLP